MRTLEISELGQVSGGDNTSLYVWMGQQRQYQLQHGEISENNVWEDTNSPYYVVFAGNNQFFIGFNVPGYFDEDGDGQWDLLTEDDTDTETFEDLDGGNDFGLWQDNAATREKLESWRPKQG